MSKKNNYRFHEPLFLTVESDWRPPKITDLPSWANAKRVAVDLETRDPYLKTLGPGGGRWKDSYTTGISFAIEDGPSAYLPIRHRGGDNLPVEEVLRYMKDQAKNFKGSIVGANLSYDIDFLASDGIEFKEVEYRDVQVADPLIYELSGSFSLLAIAQRYGLPGKDEALLRAAAQQYNVDPKADMWMLPARYVGSYAEQDSRLPLDILRKQERIIDEKNLWGIYDLESRVLPALVYLRRKGVRIDQDQLNKVEIWAESEEARLIAEIKTATGVSLSLDDCTTTSKIIPIIKHLGYEPGITDTGNPSVDKQVLANIDHPAIRALERARKMNKLRTTFCASVRRHQINGRVHCTYNQLRMPREQSDDESGAAYGRLSCQTPNLQQQPSRDDFSPMWRAIYLPEEGDLWASNDFSSQEPRMTLHYALSSPTAIGLEAWNVAKVAQETFLAEPRTDVHAMMGEMIQGRTPTKQERSEAKTIFLGLCYGMGAKKLCRQLGLPLKWVVRGIEDRWTLYEYGTPEAEEMERQGMEPFQVSGDEGVELLRRFDDKVPYVRKLAKAVETKAKKRGRIKTILGRGCHFPPSDDGGYEWAHKGLNRLIQGSSADQTKLAMVLLYENGFNLLGQVHDELMLSVKTEEEAKEAAYIMENCLPLKVPTVVDVEVGESWGESMGYVK